jgi:hypothetical protein
MGSCVRIGEHESQPQFDHEFTPRTMGVYLLAHLQLLEVEDPPAEVGGREEVVFPELHPFANNKAAACAAYAVVG